MNNGHGHKLYIAYGSNLSYSIMKYRCPDAIPLHRLMVKDACLVFRSTADLQYEPGCYAPVGLWEISAEDEERLDIAEGVSRGSYGKYRFKLDSGEKALVYLMHDKGIFPPSAWYVSKIRDGYRNFGLKESFLDEAVSHSWFRKEPTNETKRRRSRQKLTSHQRNLVKMPESLAMKLVDKGRK